MKHRLTLVGTLAIVVALSLGAGCQAAAPPPAPAAKQPAAAQPAPTQAPAAAQQPATKPAEAAPAFPTRPFDFVVPFAAGGGSGTTAELIKKIITDEKLSPQPVNISYRPGGSGLIGYAYVAGRKGDAHTFATVSGSFTSGPVLGETTMTLEDYMPIALLGLDEAILVAHPGSPFKTLKEVVDGAGKAPKSVKLALSGTATSTAVAAYMLESAAKIKFNLIPFDSAKEADTAVLGGHADLSISNPNTALSLIESGKLRAVAVFSDGRLPALKDVPAVKESYPVVVGTERGLVAPSGIAKHELDWLVGMSKKIYESKQWVEYGTKNQMTLKFLAAADYTKYLAEQRTLLTTAFTEAGLLKKK